MNTVRFLHTADWQLGMRRYFLTEEALPRFRQARIDAIRAMAEIARGKECEFAVVCGDVFESNQVDRGTIGRALEALAAMPCPVFLLPGNHDPFDAGSLYRSPEFSRRKPSHVSVLETSVPVSVRPGVEVVGVPWTTKRPRRDLVAEACAKLEPAPGLLRICAAHGGVFTYGEDPTIDHAVAAEALADGRIHYLALGDRHSPTKVGPRIWYSGAPEATSFSEKDPGHVLVVELDRERCDVEQHRTGRWRFASLKAALAGPADVAKLHSDLVEIPDKGCTVVRLGLKGSLSLRAKARLDTMLHEVREEFAALRPWPAETDLKLHPDEADLSEPGLGGFARATMDELAALAERAGDEGAVARDALTLLHRLAGGTAA